MRSTLLLPALAAVCLAPLAAQTTRAERLLAELTLEERAGQLLMCWSLTRDDLDYARAAELRRWIADPAIGGVILSLGDAETAARLVGDLQRAAKVPLLMAGDFETGLSFRLTGTTDLGKPMLWGATGSSELAREAGRVTAIEARALGFHHVFAPVLDVNSDPRNPIINVRSFGEDPAAVARLGTAFVRGCQDAGALATGKHFPGHGDVDTDSHLALPTVPGDRAHLDAVELVPFRAAIDAGLGAIMTGHLAVPGLGLAPDEPATLAPRVLTGLLRAELGFDGLIVTDALDMGALKDSADAAVRALLAGADVLLMPRDPVATRDALCAAVRSGRVPQSRLDEACLRVLRAKERAGLLAGGGLPADDWRAVVACDEHRALAGRIASAGVTLLRDPGALVPLRPGPVALVVLTPDAAPDAGRALADALSDGGMLVEVHALHGASSPDDRAAALAAVGRADARGDLVLSLVYDRADRARRPLRGLDDVLQGLAELAHSHVTAVFGDPYALRHAHAGATVICAFHGSPHTERAVVDGLLGTGRLVGRMPVSVPGLCATGAGETRLPPTPAALPRVRPQSEGFAADLPERITALLRAAIDARAFPAAVAMVARRGNVVAEVALGTETYAPDAPAIGLDARFDLASLTKVCATTPVALRLADRGDLALDARVHDLVPAFAGGDKDLVTVRHLLTHTAGLPPFRRYFRQLAGSYAVLDAVVREPLVATPGTAYRYSDLGMMLLMLCDERGGGRPFVELCESEVFAPLGMQATFANGARPLDAVPTEVCAWRGELVRGRVHDENAAAMGGVSGHAGLFGTADDVTRVAQAFLGGGRGWLSPATVHVATSPGGIVGDGNRALGWALFTPDGSGGSRLSPGSYGHTGFTGTSVWCDPRRDLSIVLLTNRVHPTRDNQAHVAVRRALADLVVDTLVDDVPAPL
ncbi:MAG: serine hydrolase [Planctomycetes bacterium]|nr:serine hydrolase [Planctomycetota bacterium]